jgi:hypothetical protein
MQIRAIGFRTLISPKELQRISKRKKKHRREWLISPALLKLTGL